MTNGHSLPASFKALGLAEPILKALATVGYETPSPIQAKTIPLLLEGRDVLGQAQTGTGKTAAFALPILQHIDAKLKKPQVLVLAPTRELAIQVAEAFSTYAANYPGIQVLPIYGGADFRTQLQGLKRGAQIVVGTPGRVMDHMRRNTLALTDLSHLVLDEADEMLRMGFIDDVEWVLSEAPSDIQIALFSATMPRQIKTITDKYLKNPAVVRIEQQNKTASTIEQKYWNVAGTHKLDALTRILEGTEFDAVIIFVRTKTATTDIAEKLQARGYAATALNGDIEQKNRSRTVEQLKRGGVDILVATDVAARGLDVERISLVINYDIPYDPEAYVHRIGRTGRAGRSGQAILFVAPRERRMLGAIEKATGQKIEPIKLPSIEMINQKRLEKIGAQISELSSDNDLRQFEALVERLAEQSGASLSQTAAALLMLKEGKKLISKDEPERPLPKQREPREPRARGERSERRSKENRTPEDGMQRFRIEVGHEDRVQPGNIVGAIANEAQMDSQHIGHIRIFDRFSLIDLPEGMPKETMHHLQGVRICGKAIKLSVDTGAPTSGGGAPKKGKRRKAPRKN